MKEMDTKIYVKKMHGAPSTFEIKLKESYNNRKSSFTYNNKTFYLKHKKGEELIYICDENKVLGMTYTDGETFIIEIEEENKNEIYGFEVAVESLTKNNNLKGDSSNEIEK